jgi:hypothetical protein
MMAPCRVAKAQSTPLSDAISGVSSVLADSPCLTIYQYNALRIYMIHLSDMLADPSSAGYKEAGKQLGYYRLVLDGLRKKLEDSRTCNEPKVWIGFYIGGHFIKITGDLKTLETAAATGQLTNQFSDRKDPLGVGFIVGYKFAPWANDIVVSPFASFDYLNTSVSHTFPNGSFLGTTSNFAATAGLKVGPQLPMGLWLYGIAGMSVLNETLKVNFIPVASSTTTTVAGATVGFGGAFQPTFLQGFGNPVSLFIEYQHTWWQAAQFDTPAASPFFNYNFRREDDTIKFGFLVSLSPPAAPAPSYPVKAPRLK